MVVLQRQIASITWKTHPVNAGLSGLYMAFKHRISFATDSAAKLSKPWLKWIAVNFGYNWFRIMPEIVSKLLRASIWSSCAVQFESELTPLSRDDGTDSCFRSAALHRIRFRTCCFVPVSYFYSETHEWSMGDALVGNNFSPIPSKSSLHMKTKSD